MKKYILFSFITISFLIISSAVLAVGGGGGGSAPSCNEDLWSCTDWGQCREDGTQVRNCVLMFECSNANTPKPADIQQCTPTPPPPPPPLTPTPQPAPAPQPSQQPPPPPVRCTQDTFTCGNWSSTCDTNGIENRSCKMTYDCPNIQTTPPISARVCQKLQCANKPDLRERIMCRLNLSPAGATRELQLQYLPEGCKAETGEERQECINIYKSFQPCWNIKVGPERFSCARTALKLGPVISEEVKLCEGKTGKTQADCKHELLDKVLYMITFHFYDLETRAEELANRGADLEAVADFETIIETKKQEFYKAENNQERLQIILEVRTAWKDFINVVKNQVK